MIRLLLDENVPPSAARALRDAGHDAVHALHVGLRGAADEAVWRRKQADGRWVVTANVRHFTPFAREQRPTAGGIVFVELGDAPASLVIRRLLDLAAWLARHPPRRRRLVRLTRRRIWFGR